MTARARVATGWTVLIAALLAVGLLLDAFWIRPQEGRLRRLREEKAELVALQVQAGGAQSATPSGETDDLMASEPTFSDPLRFLGDTARRARLQQRRLQLLAHRGDGTRMESAYEMEVYGSFQDLVAFLQAVELARPVVVITGVHLMAPLLGTDVTLRFQATVATPTTAG